MNLQYTKKELSNRSFTKKMIVTKIREDFSVILDVKETKETLIQTFLSLQEKTIKDRTLTIDEVDLTEYPIYLVRYVGYNNLLEHGSNSTPSHSTYIFNKGEWVKVREEDFRLKYFPKTRNAIDKGVLPHFECARAKARRGEDGKIIVDEQGNPIDYNRDQMVLFFEDFIKKLGDRRINGFADFTGMTEFHLLRLGSAGLRSLHDFQGIPDEWYIKNLGLANVTLAHWRDEAKRGIIQDKKEIAAMISETKGE